MNRRYSQSGFTLLETMVASASVAMAVYSFIYVFDLRAQLLARVNFSYMLSEVVVANVSEVKTRELSFLPKPGRCKVRLYSIQGVFISEDEVAIDNQRCAKQAISDEKKMEIYWKVSGTSEIAASVTFEPADFLKLPIYENSLLQVEVLGRVSAPPPGPKEQKMGTIIYRR